MQEAQEELVIDRREHIAIIACPSMKNRRESLFFSFIDRLLPLWSVKKPILHLTRSTYSALASVGFIKYYESITGDEIKFFSDMHDNGISTIAAKVAQNDIDVVYQFTATEEQYKFISENYMLRRQCIIHKKPLLINATAYTWEIFKWAAFQDSHEKSYFVCSEYMKNFIDTIPETVSEQFLFQRQICSLIAHNSMKDNIIEFADKNSEEINRFGEIVATKTTGTLLNNELKNLDTVKTFNSGPDGGDAQILEATHGKTGFIIFLQDPGNPHPHQSDIESCVKGICKPESKLSILHDSATAMSLFENMRKFVKQSENETMRPVLLSEALEKIFKINVIISDKKGQEAWKDINCKSAWYFLKSITERQKKNSHISVCVPWGSLSVEIADAFELCRNEIREYRNKGCINSLGCMIDMNVETAEDGIINLADEYLQKMSIPNASFMPMTGLVGYTDHSMDINLNVKRFANFFNGKSSEITSFAFADKNFLNKNGNYLENIEKQWENLDYALFSCRNMRSKEKNPLTSLDVHHEMKKTDAEGEIAGGIYLKADGKEVTSNNFKRIGVSLAQLRNVKEGSFFIASDPNLLNITRAALKSGAVSHFFTSLELANLLLDAEIKTNA